MKRMILHLAAVAAVSLPMGQLAMARDGRDNGGQGRGKSERQAERRDPPRREDARREPARRDDSRRPPVRAFRDEGDRRGRSDDRRYDEGPSPLPDTRPARRGGYLPDAFRGGVVDDYQRYRLRAPPRGYAWVRLNGGYALVSLDDGRIFDMVE